MYELRCMGEVALRSPIGEVIRFRSRKHLALLIYLAVNGERPHRRERLASLLWSDSESGKARHSLSQALYAVRRRAGGTIQIDGDALELDRSRIRIDSVQLERQVKAGDFATAVELYRGEFLEGFFVRRARGFEDWLERERARVGAFARDALRGAIRTARERAEWSLVRSHSQRLVRIDPYDESAYTELMRALWMLGDRAGALDLYDELKRVLRTELGTEPSTETAGLAERIRKLSVRGGWRRHVLRQAEPKAFTDPPFVGRKQEMATLAREWDYVLTGETRAVALVGEAGIGKTRLATEFIESLAVDDVQVMKGRCYEAEQVLPYGPVAEAIREALGELDLSAVNPRWLAELVRIVPEVAEHYDGDLPEPPVLEAEGSRRRLYEGIAQVMRDLCEQRPLVLFVDDVHWADESSLSLLHYLLRRVNNGMFLLCVCRSEDPSASTNGAVGKTYLSGWGTIKSVRLLGLDSEASTELVSTLITDVEFKPKELIGMASGNPLFVIELARGIAGQDSPDSVHPSATLPERIRSLFKRHFIHVDDKAYALAEHAAVLGPRSDWQTLAEAASVDHLELSALVRSLVRHGLFATEGDKVGFRHDLMRSYLRSQIGRERSRVLNLRAARALMRGRGSAGEIARHFSTAGETKRAYAFALRAARLAESVFALTECSSLLELALKNAPTEKIRADLCGRLGNVYAQLRKYERARKLLNERLEYLVESTNSVEATVECRLHLYIIDVESGRIPIHKLLQPLRCLYNELEEAGDDAPNLRLDILSKIFWASTRTGEAHAANLLMSKVKCIHAGSRNPNVKWRALRLLGIYSAYTGKLDSAKRSLTQAIKEAAKIQDRQAMAEICTGLSVLAAKSLDRKIVDKMLNEHLALFEDCGDPGIKAVILGNCGAFYVQLLETETARELLEKARETVSGNEELVATLGSIEANLGFNAYLEGNLREAEKALLDAIAAGQRAGEVSLEIEATAALGLVAIKKGNIKTARKLASRILYLQRLGRYFIDQRFLVEVLLAEVRFAGGKLDRVFSDLEKVANRWKERDIPCYLHIQRLRTQLLRRAGRLTEASEALVGLRETALERNAPEYLNDIE